jgi:tRNA-specific 2-thiouridylase
MYQPGIQKKGFIQTVEGEVLGEHHGLSNYTIGQRKGVSKGGGTPYFVVEKDVLTNTLIVCRKEQLGTSRIRIESINWLDGTAPVLPFTADIKIRYKATPVKGTISDNLNYGCDIIFDVPIRDATPGQYAVIYDDDIVVGSGVIIKTNFAEGA